MKKVTILVVLFLGYHVIGDEDMDLRRAMRDANAPALEAAVPGQVLLLTRWPDAAVLTGTGRTDPDAIEVAAAKIQAWNWLRRVLDTSWLPPEKTEMLFIRKEFWDFDVARVTWIREGYRIEVAQTASVFTIKVMPQMVDSMGRDSRERFEVAQKLCLQLFNREGRMWTQNPGEAGRPVVVPELNKRIVEFSFDAARMKKLPADNVVLGEGRSMKDEGIDSASPSEGLPEVTTPNLGSSEAWHYWYRNVNWWNDGQSVVFYFLKIEGIGAWVPSWVGEIDVNWFQEPRRLGRPVKVQPD